MARAQDDRTMGRRITDEINADPAEVARLRASRNSARTEPLLGWRYSLTPGSGPERDVTRDEYVAEAAHGQFARLPMSFTVKDVSGRVQLLLPPGDDDE
jgi:hypothetical protein